MRSSMKLLRQPHQQLGAESGKLMHPQTLQKARAQITMQIHTIKTLTHAASKTAAADQRETHGQETQTELH